VVTGELSETLLTLSFGFVTVGKKCGGRGSNHGIGISGMIRRELYWRGIDTKANNIHFLLSLLFFQLIPTATVTSAHQK